MSQCANTDNDGNGQFIGSCGKHGHNDDKCWVPSLPPSPLHNPHLHKLTTNLSKITDRHLRRPIPSPLDPLARRLLWPRLQTRHHLHHNPTQLPAAMPRMVHFRLFRRRLHRKSHQHRGLGVQNDGAFDLRYVFVELCVRVDEI